MINIDLTENEYDLIINHRKAKYNMDITEDEYNTIISHRNFNVKRYEKYIENIQKLINQDNKFLYNQLTQI